MVRLPLAILPATSWTRLFQLGNKILPTINIHANNDHAFKLACSNGHMEIAKWLFQLGNDLSSPINIHAGVEDAFRYAGEEGHIEMHIHLQHEC